MTNAELLAKIKAEIKRLFNRSCLKRNLARKNNYSYSEIVHRAEMDVCSQLLYFISDIEKSLPKVDCEGLNEEINRTYHDGSVANTSDIDHVTYENIAEYFYDLGCRRTAEKYDEIEYNRQREEGRVLPGFEDEPKGIPGKDFVPVEWVETLERYGKWKIVKLEEDGSSEIPKDLLDAQVEIVEKLIGENNNDGANASHPFACEYVVELLQKAVSAGAKWQADHTPLPEDTVIYQKGVEEGKRLMMEEAVEGEFLYTPYPTIELDDCKDYNFTDFDKVRVIVLPKED